MDRKEELAENVFSDAWWVSLIRDIHETLEAYVRVGVLEDFFIIQSKRGPKFVVVVKTSTDNVSFDVYPNTLSESRGEYEIVEFGRSTVSGYDVTVTPITTPEMFCLEMLDTLHLRKEIVEREKRFIERMRKRGVEIYHARQEDDVLHATDCFVSYKGVMVPVQLKSSVKHQEAHRRIHPTIPSLICDYSNERYDDVAVRALKDIADAYVSRPRRILHLDAKKLF